MFTKWINIIQHKCYDDVQAVALMAGNGILNNTYTVQYSTIVAIYFICCTLHTEWPIYYYWYYCLSPVYLYNS